MRGALPSDDGLWQHAVILGIRDDLSQFFASHHHFLVACSGGRDSLLIAALLHHVVPDRVRVVHVDHGLQSPSAQWAQQVTQWCAQRELPCVVHRVHVGRGNVEAAARQARHTALLAELLPHEVLVLGHHQQDQAETVLMRLCQGVVGLAAMRAHDVWQGYPRWRPLLTATRADITAWAAALQIDYIDDPANADDHYDRVWMRQTLWPSLIQRWPSAAVGMQRTAALMHDTADILADVVAMDWAACQPDPVHPCIDVLSVPALMQLSVARQRLLLSRWLQGDEPYAPPLARVQAVLAMLTSRVDGEARVDWQTWQVRRYQLALYRLPQHLPLAVDQHIEAQPQQCLTLPSGVWQLVEGAVEPCLRARLPNDWFLSARQGGERLHLSGRIGHWPLKKLLQSGGIPPWQRQMIHVLSDGQQPLGVFTPLGFWATTAADTSLNGWQWVRLAPHKGAR
jgi:tRNA(Ile)-lysidine synthase